MVEVNFRPGGGIRGKPLKKARLRTSVAMTVAGSDSGGCAGIQADLRTFRNLGVHGACAITCVTAQNTLGVQEIAFLAPAFIQAQILSVLSDIGCHAAKTGMLGNRAIVMAVAWALAEFGVRKLVVDPVMVSTSGSTLLRPDAVRALRRQLIPLGMLVTPNLQEAELLTGRPVRTPATMESAARALYDDSGCPVLIKGGHLSGRPVDLFYDGRTLTRFSAPRVRTRHTHGSGCTLAAAITALLARGESLGDAIAGAKDYVHAALKSSYALGKGPGPLGNVG
jgi:hydroxymethylpyrimidine/phosphomethylpyrimidine kinase